MQLKKLWKHKYDDDTYRSWCGWKDPHGLGKETGGTGDQRKNQDYPDYNTFEIS